MTAARRWRRRLLAAAGPLALATLVAVLVATHGDAIGHAVTRVSAATIVLSVVLTLVTLVARTEAVVASLAAMGARPRRADIHSANGLTFLAGSVNHYISAPVRAALLRRIDRERAPSILQMFMVDAATTLVEGLLVVVLILVSASTLHLHWWLPVLIALAAAAGTAFVFAVRRRFGSHPAFRGLDVLVHSRQRIAVAGLMVVVIVGNVVRTMIVLDACGLHPSLVQGVSTFVAAGVLSTLVVGPSAGAAGAPLIIFGSSSIGAAGAAGLVMSATALIGSFVYALASLPAYGHGLRRRAREQTV